MLLMGPPISHHSSIGRNKSPYSLCAISTAYALLIVGGSGAAFGGDGSCEAGKGAVSDGDVVVGVLVYSTS